MRVLRIAAALSRARILAVALALLLTGCGPAPAEVRIEPLPAPSEAVRALPEPDYVLNPSTHRFHRPDCAAAAKIAPYRRIDWTGEREELLAAGYDPCKICDP